MKKEEITDLLEQFESISSTVEGVECWSARNLQPVQTRKTEVIEQHILDCERLKGREKLSQTEKDIK